ncbi:hypothetical protein ATO6_23660 [Oceanicola sp. 22II-s10i]|nr:hypothetical protein ATO6_23660 [Oceanicola sp. 22II-s10i]
MRLTGTEVRPAARQVALVPGAEVPVLSFDLPAGLRGMAREQIARRQFRDRAGLGDASIELRPFHRPGGADSWTRALVADAGRIAEWRGTATACRAVLPDYLSLPAADGVWTLAVPEAEVTSEAVMARLGPDDGFSAAAALAPRMIARALDAATPPPRALLRLGPPFPAVESLFQARGIPVHDDPAALIAAGLPEPVVLGHGELDFDLRRDPQAARARLRRRVLPWRWPLMGALLAAGLWAAAQYLAIGRIEAVTAGIDTATRTLVREHFVPVGPVLDIRVQVARALEAARAAADTATQPSDPLEIFGRAAEVIAAEGARTMRVDYAPADGVTLVLRLDDFAAADRMGGALEVAGLTVEMLGSRVAEGGDGVRIELRVTAPEGKARP